MPFLVHPGPNDSLEANQIDLRREDTEEIIPEVFPIPAVNQAWNQTFVPQAFLEPALLHAMLGITSSTIRMKYVKPFNPEVAFTELQYHKVASIKLINRKLQNASDATQLSTILTIVTLLCSEVRTPI